MTYLPLLLHVCDLAQPLPIQGDPAKAIIDRFSTSVPMVINHKYKPIYALGSIQRESHPIPGWYR